MSYQYLKRPVLAEKYQISEVTVSRYRRQMEASGIFDKKAILSGAKYLYIAEEAFQYFLAHRQEIQEGKAIKPWK